MFVYVHVHVYAVCVHEWLTLRTFFSCSTTYFFFFEAIPFSLNLDIPYLIRRAWQYAKRILLSLSSQVLGLHASTIIPRLAHECALSC